MGIKLWVRASESNFITLITWILFWFSCSLLWFWLSIQLMDAWMHCPKETSDEEMLDNLKTALFKLKVTKSHILHAWDMVYYNGFQVMMGCFSWKLKECQECISKMRQDILEKCKNATEGTLGNNNCFIQWQEGMVYSLM